MNPYIKNFFEKLLEIEKIIKYSVEILIEFECLQRSWLYLQSIFSQNLLSDALSYEMDLWQNIDSFFKSTVRSFIEVPLVYKIVGREGFIS
jgi:aryl-phospho-beta-D-glucosidase BglC (GH1 family)